jgi:hypothetical protein
MADQGVKQPRQDESLSGTKDSFHGTVLVNLALAGAVYGVATFYTSRHQAAALAVGSLVPGILNIVRAQMSKKGVGVLGPLILIGGLALVAILFSKDIIDHMPRPVPETIIVGVQQGRVDDRVFGALTGSTQCNPAELALVMTAPEDKDYVSPVQCVGEVWEAVAMIGRRDTAGNIHPGDAKVTYTLRVFSGPKETVLQAIKGQVIPPGLTKISGDVDKGFTPGPLVVNSFRLIH